MSAVLASPPKPSLTISLRDRRRQLFVSLQENSWIYVSVGPLPPRKGGEAGDAFASATGRIAGRDAVQFAIHWDYKGRPALWINSAAFHVSEGEVTRLAEAFGEHGLQIHRDEAQS